MMKFFRRNTKTLLAVFMALLLIVWLGGSALYEIFDRDASDPDEVFARAYGEPVTMGQMQQINNRTELLQKLIPVWDRPWLRILASSFGPQAMQGLMERFRGEALTEPEFYMLDAEARASGVYVSPESIERIRDNFPPEQLNALRDEHRVSLEQIDEALALYLRVEQAFQQAAAGIKVSEADIQDYVRDTTEKVQVVLATIDAAKLVDTGYEPSREEMVALFEQYKNTPAGSQGGYGYQQPEAVQIEYIQINVNALAGSQSISEDEAFSYWERNKEQFLRPASQPASGPTTAPATREAPKPYATFTAARLKVLERMRRDRARKAAESIARDLIAQLSRPWTTQPATGPAGYHQPPVEALAGDVYENQVRGTRYGNALVFNRTPLVDASALASTPIGMATAFPGLPSATPFSEVAFLVAGLEKGDVQKRDPNLNRFYRNLYETSSEPVFDAQGNAYVFRTTAIRPKQAPATVDEVAVEIVNDLRAKRAYDQAVTIARDLAEKARAQGLKQAFQSDAALAAKLANPLAEPPSFARAIVLMGYAPQRYEGFIPGVGMNPELSRLCFELGGRVTATQPLPVDIHEERGQQRVHVVQWLKTIPVTHKEYEEQRERAMGYVSLQRQLDFLADWFEPEKIRARVQWKNPDGSDVPAEEQPARAGL